MEDMHAGLIWMIVGLVLLGVEILAPGVFMMWLGMAAIVAGLLVWLLDLAFAMQVVLFAVLAAIALGIGIKLRPRARPGLNTQIAGLVGRSATAVSFQGREGRVRVGDSDWAAKLASGAAIPEPGAALRVDGVHGTVLVVRPEG
jgi:membrane protein implicated in regulation of membrane protease activity